MSSLLLQSRKRLYLPILQRKLLTYSFQNVYDNKLSTLTFLTRHPSYFDFNIDLDIL